MNILALLTDGFGACGGIARYNRDLVTALAQSAVVTNIAIAPRYGETREPLPRGVVQLAPMADRVRWSARAIRLALSPRFDVIFCGHLFAAPLAAALAALTGKPMWLQLHGVEAWPTPGRAIRKATDRAQLITSVSRYTRQQALRWSAIDPARVCVLPNTVDPRFAPGPAPAALRARLGLGSHKVILTVSRLAAQERYKGHDRIILAMPKILTAHPEAIYLVVGDGDDRARLESLARETGMSAYVRFAGRADAGELPDIYRLADVFAMPSTGEGFGVAFLEAAASGLPIVAGNCDGSVDALAQGAIGALINPRDVGQIAAAIVAALNCGAGNALAGQRFAFQNFAQHVDKIVRHRL